VLPLGTLTVEETKAPDGYLLDGAYMQADGSEEQIKGLYVTQIVEDGDLAILSGSNQYKVSDKVIRGGVKIQKRDLETSDTSGQGSATLKDAEFSITSLNDSPVLVERKLGTMSRIRTHLIDTFFIFKTSFVIVRRFIVTMTVNPNCIVKCFDIFKYHLVCHLIINDLFSIQPLSFN